MLWAVNDSGNDPLLWALGTDGRLLGTVRVAGVKNEDWEALASFELDGESWLVIGDVGDNDAVRATVRLHYVREPVIDGGKLPEDASVRPERTVNFSYEDGPRDCESLAVDVLGRRVLLMSKRVKPPALYELPLRPHGKVVAAKIAPRVSIPALDEERSRLLARLARYATQPTAMDLSSDGRTLVVQTYTDAFRFRRGKGQTWAGALAEEPERIPVPLMPQAEALAFSRAGRSFWVSSEHTPNPLVLIDPDQE